MFESIVPPLRQSDPEYFRFEVKLYFQYIAARFLQWNDSMIQAVNAMGAAFRKATVAFAEVGKLLAKG